MSMIEERVRAGMALLDERAPGWEGRVDLDNLHLSSCQECVLGHVFGSFNAGLGELQDAIYSPAVWGTSEDFGFSDSSNRPGRYGALTAAWKRAIRARRADRPLPTEAL